MNIAIIGGGIGGLALGVALSRQGIDYTIYEAAEEIREVGAGLWMAPNALTVLERLGVVQHIYQQGVRYSEVRIETYRGEIIRQHKLAPIEKKYGHGIVALTRSALQRILYDHVDQSRVFTGKRCVAVRQHQEKAIAEFEDGTAIEADLIVGADGLRSTVRKHILGNIPLRYSGQTCWRALVPFEFPPNRFAGLNEIWGRESGLRMGMGYVAQSTVYFYITVKAEPDLTDEQQQLVPHLLSLCRDFPGLNRDVIAATSPEAIIRTDLYDFKPLKRWHRGRVVLLGDAAHATTPNLGQGACQAIESAYALAQLLAKESSLEKALQRYFRLRKSRTAFITQTSWQIGQLTNLNGPLGAWLKFTLPRVVPEAIQQQQFHRIYDCQWMIRL